MKKQLFFLIILNFSLSNVSIIQAGNGAGWFVGGLAAGALTTAAINNRPRREYVEVRTTTVDTTETDRLQRRLQVQEQEIYRMKEEKRREQQQKEEARNKKRKEEKKAQRKQQMEDMQSEYNKELARLKKEILQKEELIEKLQQDDTKTESSDVKQEISKESKDKEKQNKKAMID